MAIENIVQTQYSDDASIEYINTINARNDAELMQWGLPDENIAEINKGSNVNAMLASDTIAEVNRASNAINTVSDINNVLASDKTGEINRNSNINTMLASDKTGEINRASNELVELTNRYTFKQFPKNDIPTTDVVNTQQTKTISDVPTMEDVPKTSAGRTIFYDSEGFPYSEKTETIQTKFGWVNTPTVNESGNQVNIDEIADWLNNQDSPIDFVTGRPLQVFNSSDEAVKVAQQTSDGYGNELQGQDKSMLEKGYEMLPEGGKKLVWPLIAPFVVGAKEESPLARGVFTGVIQDAPNAVLSLTRDIANALGANYTEEEYLQIPQLLQQSDSTAENITKTFSQFLSIFGAVGGFSKGSTFLGQMARGGFADSTFDPAMGNLGTVLKENNIWPELTQYWDSKVGEDATAFERLKARAVNSVEGGVLSAVIDLSIRAVKYAKNDPQLKVWMSNFLDKVDDLSRKLPETQMSANFGQTQVASPQRVGTTGQYIGAPEGINTPQALGKLRRNMTALAKQGEEGRFWYERSGQAILDVTGGNIDEAEKIAQAIAVTSAGSTPVGMNMEFALQAYNQFKAGKPIMTGKFPKSMIPRLESIFKGEGWEGRKTNTFYNNLMATIDPKRSQGVTVDMHMMRVFGFKTDAPSPKQYDFVENEINRISNELGWNNYQTQAAIWVAQKANRANKPVTEMKFDYSDAINKTMGQISWETKPSASSGHLKEIFNAPMSQQTEFHYAMSKALTDDNGQDVIAKELGILSPGSFDAPGVFEGTISPGTQTQVLMPKKYKGQLGQVDDATLDLVEMYSAIRGILFKQDGVGYHRPFWEKSIRKGDLNGIDANIGRPLEPEEAQQLDSIISEITGLNYLSPVSTDTGFRLINFSDLDNKEYEKLMREVLDRFEISDKIQIKQFSAQTGYVGNDWSKNKNGELYLGGRFEGRPDIQQRIRTIVKKYNARIEAVEDDFSDKYGWTKGEYNTEYKQPTEIKQDFSNQNINSNTGKASVPAAVGVGEMSVSEENIQPSTVGKKPNAESVAAIATSQNPVDAAIKYIGLREKDTEGEQAIRNFFNNAVEGDFAPGTSDTDLARKNAWCAAFLSQVLTDSGYDTNIFAGKDKYQKLRAKEYRNIGSGVETSNAKPGDIMIKMHSKEDQKKYKLKPNSGHVGIVVKVEGDQVFFIGGNTGDKVEISSYNYKEKDVTIRRIKGISDIPKKTSDLYLDFQGSAGKKVRQIKNWFKEL